MTERSIPVRVTAGERVSHPPGLVVDHAQEFADAWDHLGAVKLDVGHECFVREASHAVLQVEAGRAKEPGALMGRGGLSSVDSVRSDRSGRLTLCDVAFVSSSMFTVFRRVLSTVLSVFV